ncbi:MAG: ferrochelatase [Acidobacteriaceae bacterium]|nr:ferrochelatase [Acidobacteriaceae bacterium]
MSHAILLLAHGTPDTLDQMAEYLSYVTNGRPMPQHIVEELQHRYAEIGLRNEPLPEGPPLTHWTLEQGRLLSEKLGQKVYVGMRNWHPFLADVVAQMKQDGITRATVLCLAPQNSRTSTGLYRRALDKALEGAFPYTFIAGWAEHPLLAKAFAQKLEPAWLAANARQGRKVPVLFTAHSVPCRTLRPATEQQAAEGSNRPGQHTPAEGLQNYGAAAEGDPYPSECKRTAALVAQQLVPAGMESADWFFAFQSQGVAGAPWIGPSVEDTLTALAEEGHKAVVIQPIGFLCDHVEILYDIDINFRDFGKEHGLEISRPESLNASPLLIEAIADVLARNA